MKIIQALNYSDTEKDFFEFQVNSCGIMKNIDIDTGVNRKNGRSDYHIICIKRGPFYINKEENRSVGDNTAVLFLPGEPQMYGCKKDEGAEYCWIHFEGKVCENILKKCGFFYKKCINTTVGKREFAIIEKMINEITYKSEGYEIKIFSLFLELLCNLSRDDIKKADKNNIEPIMPALTEMSHRPEFNYSVSEYASMCNISSYHFLHKFKEVMGQSPMQYKNEVLMKQAAYLIENTNLTIKEISEKLGISDSMYFSKKFKLFFGVSPTEFKNNKRSEL